MLRTGMRKMIDIFANKNDGLDDIEIDLACKKLGLENDEEYIQNNKQADERIKKFFEARKTYLDSMKEKIVELRKEKALKKQEEGETKDDLDEQIE